jgi:hypothetical protein
MLSNVSFSTRTISVRGSLPGAAASQRAAMKYEVFCDANSSASRLAHLY